MRNYLASKDLGLTGMFVGCFGAAFTALYATATGESTATSVVMLLFVFIFSLSGIRFVGGEPDR